MAQYPFNQDQGPIRALKAIVARLNGDWDNPDLIAHGFLFGQEEADIRRIAEEAIHDFENKNY